MSYVEVTRLDATLIHSVLGNHVEIFRSWAPVRTQTSENILTNCECLSIKVLLLILSAMVPGRNVRPLTYSVNAGFTALAETIYETDPRSLCAGFYEAAVVGIEKNRIDFLNFVLERDTVFSGSSLCFVHRLQAGQTALAYSVQLGRFEIYNLLKRNVVLSDPDLFELFEISLESKSNEVRDALFQDNIEKRRPMLQIAVNKSNLALVKFFTSVISTKMEDHGYLQTDLARLAHTANAYSIKEFLEWKKLSISRQKSLDDILFLQMALKMNDDQLIRIVLDCGLLFKASLKALSVPEKRKIEAFEGR